MEKIMNKYLSSLAVCAFLATTANAGAILDVEVGGGMFSTDAPTGTVNANGYELDAQDKMKLGSTSDNMYAWAVLDHGIPVIPNVRVEQVTLKSSGTNSSLSGGPINGDVDSELDMSNTDLILYWGVPFATWAPFLDELDFGVGAKMFSGGLTMSNGTVADSIDESFSGGVVPYGYAKLRVEPPFMFGVGLEGEVKYIAYDAGSVEASFSETIIKADWGYLFPIPALDIEPGVEVGYRNMSIDIDSSDMTTDVGFSGIFFGVYAKFGL
jgi:outer membrane protein